MNDFALKFETRPCIAGNFIAALVLCRADGTAVKEVVHVFADRHERGWRHDGGWNLCPGLQSLPYMPEATPAEYAAALETAMRAYVAAHRMPTVLRYCATAAGIADKSYSTVRFGWIESFDGEVNFTLEGAEYHAVGRGPDGNAEFVTHTAGNLRVAAVAAVA